MTPASPLSRLEKLAKEKYPRMYSCRGAAMFGAKTILQILSEPGEACGPRDEDVPSRIWVKGLNGKYCLNTSIATPLEGWSYPKEGCAEYASSAELLQARAAHEVEEASYEAQLVEMTKLLAMRREERDAATAALASSEARVRILSEAVEKIASFRQTGRDHLDTAALVGVARRALLEVQR